MTEKLERIRAVRAGNRGVITKLTREAEKLWSEEDFNNDRLRTIATMLDEKIKTIKDLDEHVLTLCAIEDIEREIEEADDIYSRVLDTKRQISKIISKAAKPHGDEVAQGGVLPGTSGTPSMVVQESPFQASASFVSHQTRSKLPKLVLPKFKGDITHYHTFWDSFESAVHRNPDLSKIDKFNYLNSLLEGPASRAIQGLTVTENNYHAAIEILQQRFGKPQQIISAHMDELLKIPACTGDKPSQLRFVYDKVSVHVRGLEALGVNSSQYGSLLIPVIMAKLPQEVRVQIARNTTQDIWEMTDLLNVIRREVEAREISDNVRVNTDNRKPHPPLQRPPTAATLIAQETSSKGKPIQCVYCADYHFSASCDRIIDTRARKEILQRDKRCFVCLRMGHRSNQCERNKGCRRCHGKHHQSICERPFQPSRSSPPVQVNLTGESLGPNNRSSEVNNLNPTSVSHTTATSTKGRCKVLLQTVATYAQGTNDSNPVPVRILLDSGSQRSYVTNALKEKLGLVPTKTETLNLNTFGDERFTKQRCDLVKLSLQGKDEEMEISALCFPKICSPLATNLDVSRYPHLQDLDLADVNIVEGSQPNIDILIGSDYYFDIITGEIVRGDSGPVAVSSKFGWVVSGPACEIEAITGISVANLIIEKRGPLATENPYVANEDETELTSALRRFWDIESLGIKEERNTNEREFLREVRFKEDEGRYEVNLPWKTDSTPKSDGYLMCVNRLRQLHSRLKKDKSLLGDYNNIIKEQEKAGIVEPVSRPQESGHFLPHHGVIRQDKETTKLRVVFDGSAKSGKDSLALNDCLEKGPNLVPHLFDTVVKFRGYPIGIVADIEKAFHQIQIAPDDRRMLKFLWFDDIEKERPEIKQYQFRRLPFGLTPSPAFLASTIRHHLSLYQEREPKIVSLLRDSLYVDDFAGGAYEDTEALQIYDKSKKLMKNGGFTLRKWNSNSKSLRENIAAQETAKLTRLEEEQTKQFTREKETTEEFKDTIIITEESLMSFKTQQASSVSDEVCHVKFLGINWNVDTNEFRYDLTELASYAQSLPATKRSVLKLSAKVFDPMGLVTPFTVNMKMLFQTLCTMGAN